MLGSHGNSKAGKEHEMIWTSERWGAEKPVPWEEAKIEPGVRQGSQSGDGGHLSLPVTSSSSQQFGYSSCMDQRDFSHFFIKLFLQKRFLLIFFCVPFAVVGQGLQRGTRQDSCTQRMNSETMDRQLIDKHSHQMTSFISALSGKEMVLLSA
jgi:hypothetical protein